MDREQYSSSPRAGNLPRAPLFPPYLHQYCEDKSSKRLDDESFGTLSRRLLGVLSFFENGQNVFANGRTRWDINSTLLYCSNSSIASRHYR